MKKLFLLIGNFLKSIFSKPEPTDSISEILEEISLESLLYQEKVPESPQISSPHEWEIHARNNGVHEFVITARNKENSIFYIRPKSDFEQEKFASQDGIVRPPNWVAPISPFEGVFAEDEIMRLYQTGFIFWVFNPEGNKFTPIRLLRGHITTPRNKTKTDNISSLPIMQAGDFPVR